MTTLERRIAALEKRAGPAIRLGVCVFLGESDDAAIRRTVAENGFALDQIAAAVLFYVPDCPRPEAPPWDASAKTGGNHQNLYAEWVAQVKPMTEANLRPESSGELRNWVSLLDLLRVFNHAPQGWYDSFCAALPLSNEDRERVSSEWVAVLKG